MISDEERREVARRLREVNPYRNQSYTVPYHRYTPAVEYLSELAGALGYSPKNDVSRLEFQNRLADLIEPQPITEGEPPHNLYSLYEAVLRRHPRSEHAIEDAEVDALVDALLEICNAPGHELIQRPQPSYDRDALIELADEMGRVRSKCDFCIKKGDCDWADETICLESHIDDYAQCIREALGVQDG